MAAIDPLTAVGVVLATAATDAAAGTRRRATTAEVNWVYVAFAAVGSWLGAFATITFLHRPPGGPPVGASVE